MMLVFAEEHSCITQFEPGERYETAELGKRDDGNAFKWYRVAARKRFRRAQHRLDGLCARGLGVAQDLPRACARCGVAAFRDSRPARRKLRQIETQMNTEALRRGRYLAHNFDDRCVVPRLPRAGDFATQSAGDNRRSISSAARMPDQ